MFIALSTALSAQAFRFSEGLYRIPYGNNIPISVGSDVWTHNPLGKYDINTDVVNPPIVAAADGWVRAIQESFDTACFQNNGGVVTCCWQLNNYVIIEHPNGEWSGYTHMQVGSTTDQGIAVNDWVTAGTTIGIEGTVGCSTGNHLHWEVSRPPDGSNGFQNIGGFLLGELLIPVICGIGTVQPWLVGGQDYIAGPCDDNCPTQFLVDQNVGNGGVFVARADETVITDNVDPVIFSNGSVTQFRSADHIIMRPGFRASTGARMEAMIKSCNFQE